MKKYIALLIILLAPWLANAQKLYPFLFKNQQWGFVDEQLQVKIKPSYDFVTPFKEGVAAVEQKGNWGFIDATGKKITPMEYVDFNPWNEGLIPVQNRSGLWGYLNYQGRVAIPFAFEEANTFRFGRAPAAKNRKYGMIDRGGKFVLANKYLMLDPFNKDGFTTGGVTLNTAEVIDTLGKVYPHLPAYSYSLPHEGIYYKVNPQLRKYGFFEVKDNKAITPFEYDLAYNFGNGLAPVKKSGKWGYIDKQNKVVVAFQFDDASAFSEGLAVVKVGKKKGVINTKGQFVFQPQFDTLTDFQDGVAEATLQDNLFYIRADGKVLKE